MRPETYKVIVDYNVDGTECSITILQKQWKSAFTVFRTVEFGSYVWNIFGRPISTIKDGEIRLVNLLNQLILDAFNTQGIDGIYVFDREFSEMEQVYLNCC
jgi:hypothetical protein